MGGDRVRVALYARVSTEEQSRHGLSIDAQLAALDAWAADKTVVDHYVDLGISARKPASKRPELQRLLRDVEAGKIDLIAFCKLDRWFRSVQEYYKVNEILDRHRVAWTAIQEDYETQTASGRLKLNIFLAVAQDEADRTGERIRAVFDRKRERGEVLNQQVPLGISVVEKRRVANEDADKVRALFRYYLATRSMRRVVMDSPEVIGQQIAYQPLRDMLVNPAYVEAGVIDRVTFDAVARMRRERGPRTNRSGRVYLFSGIAFCASCGRRLAAHCMGGTLYYRCPLAADGGGACQNSRHVREDVVEAFLLEHLMGEVETVRLRLKEKRRPAPDPSAIRRKMDRLTDLHLSDLITREKYEADFRALQAALVAAENVKRPPEAEDYRDALGMYDSLSRLGKRAFWNTALDRIDCADGAPVSFTLRLSAGPLITIK